MAQEDSDLVLCFRLILRYIMTSFLLPLLFLLVVVSAREPAGLKIRITDRGLELCESPSHLQHQPIRELSFLHWVFMCCSKIEDPEVCGGGAEQHLYAGDDRKSRTLHLQYH